MFKINSISERINKLVTLATKFHWDFLTAEKEIKMLDPEKMEEKIPAFANTLKERHAPNDWKDVLKSTAHMMTKMGEANVLTKADYPQIRTGTLLLLGDNDKMVTIEETLDVYHALPESTLTVLPETPHPIEQVNMDTLSGMLSKYFG